MTLKSVKLSEEAVEAVNDFKQKFKCKNQSEAVVLGLSWGMQFFSSNVQVKDNLFGKVKQHDMILNALLKRQSTMDGAITKLWLQAQVLMKLHPEAKGELEKLIAEVQKAKAELKGIVTTKQELKGVVKSGKSLRDN